MLYCDKSIFLMKIFFIYASLNYAHLLRNSTVAYGRIPNISTTHIILSLVPSILIGMQKIFIKTSAISCNRSKFYTYRSFATRVSQLKIWHFLFIGIERNFCRCNFNRYIVITQFAKLPAGEQLWRRCTQKIISNSKPLKVSPEKSNIF
jgi:hypothetical protein